MEWNFAVDAPAAINGYDNLFSKDQQPVVYFAQLT
jgi:hypothetical protein